MMAVCRDEQSPYWKSWAAREASAAEAHGSAVLPGLLFRGTAEGAAQPHRTGLPPR